MTETIAPPTAKPIHHWIGGKSVASSSGRSGPVWNPATGEQSGAVDFATAEEVDAAVQAARRAFETGAWPGLTASERGRLLWKLGELVLANAERLATIEQRDNGKLASEVVAQVRYMADYFRYYAGLADKVQSDVIPTDKKGVFAYTKYEAKGAPVTKHGGRGELADGKVSSGVKYPNRNGVKGDGRTE